MMSIPNIRVQVVPFAADALDWLSEINKKDSHKNGSCLYVTVINNHNTVWYIKFQTRHNMIAAQIVLYLQFHIAKDY